MHGEDDDVQLWHDDAGGEFCWDKCGDGGGEDVPQLLQDEGGGGGGCATQLWHLGGDDVGGIIGAIGCAQLHGVLQDGFEQEHAFSNGCGAWWGASGTYWLPSYSYTSSELSESELFSSSTQEE